MVKLNRTQPPLIKNSIDFDLQLPACKRFTLDNGVQVYAIDAGAQEVTLVELVFYAGNWFEEKNIVAGTANFLLKNGTSTRSGFQVNEHFEYYGSYLNRNCYNETANITLHSLTRHLSELLPVVSELITDAVFPEDELAIYKQNQKQRLKVSLKKADFVANRFVDEYLYGFHHPYGRYTSLNDYEALEREEIVKFYNDYYRYGSCIIFVAGNVPADMMQQLNNAFGHLPLRGTAPALPHISPTPAEQRKHRIINDKDGVQGAVRIARPFVNRHHPDFVKVQVLNSIFGGFFGSRLMSNIREDKGYTYGIQSYLQNHVQTTAWVVSTEAGRDVCEATIQEVYKEMKDLREEPVDDDELALVKNYMIGSILGDLDGPFQVISRWKNYILNGLDETYFYKSVDAIKAIDADELLQLAQKYLVPEEFYELVVV